GHVRRSNRRRGGAPVAHREVARSVLPTLPGWCSDLAQRTARMSSKDNREQVCLPRIPRAFQCTRRASEQGREGRAFLPAFHSYRGMGGRKAGKATAVLQPFTTVI